MLSQSNLDKVKGFCQYISKNEHLLYDEKLFFFKSFMEKYGAEIPPKHLLVPQSEDKKQKKRTKPIIEVIEEEDDNSESLKDVYLDSMGTTVVPSKKTKSEAVKYKKIAVQFFREKKYKESALHFGKSIELSGGAYPILFIKRAECFLFLERNLSSRRDCDKAIEINKNLKVKKKSILAKPYRIRGKVFYKMGNLEEAVKDFKKSLEYEEDEEIQKLCGELSKIVERGYKKEKVERIQKSLKQESGLVELFRMEKVKKALREVEANPQKLNEYLNHDDEDIRKVFSFCKKQF